MGSSLHSSETIDLIKQIKEFYLLKNRDRFSVVYWKVDALTDYMSLDNNFSFDMFCIEAFQKWPNAQKQKNKSP